MGKKKVNGYDAKALMFFEKVLENILWPNGRRVFNVPRINTEWLEAIIKALPKKDRENIEKFWGLTGGTNYSKRIRPCSGKDIAYINMRYAATASLNVLLIDMLAAKIDKGKMKISNLEAAKYLEAFVIFVLNGPRMGFENDPLTIEKEVEGECTFDNWPLLRELCADINCLADKSVNLKLMIDFLESRNYRDSLIIRKSIGIELTDDCEVEDVEAIKTYADFRAFKEQLFPYGPWNVTSALLIGDPKGEIKLEDFMKELNSIRKDWSIEKYKTGQMSLQTTNEIRQFNVYTIGGLEFTDLEEVMFLYLERNLIAP